MSMHSLRYHCCVPGCDTKLIKLKTREGSIHNATGVVLCLFPKEKEVCDVWLDRIGVENFKKFTLSDIREHLRICIKHFSSYSLISEEFHLGVKRLMPYKFGSLPTLHLPNFHEEPSEENSFFSSDIIDITPKRLSNGTTISPSLRRVSNSSTVRLSSPLTLVRCPKPLEAVPVPAGLLPKEKVVQIEPVKETQVSSGDQRKKRSDGAVPRSSSPPPVMPSAIDRGSEEFFKLSEMFDRVSADRPPPLLKRKVPSETDGEPSKKRLAFKVDGENESFDKFIIETFNSAGIMANNSFAALNQQPQPTFADHSYGSSSTVEILKSSAQLCDYNERKLKTLRQLFQSREDEIAQVEETTLKFVNDVLDNHAVDLIKECFSHLLPSLCKRQRDKDSEMVLNKSSTELKQFFIILLMYSWKAYTTLLPILDLPSQHDVRTWATSHAGCYPGFTSVCIQRVKHEVERIGKGLVLTVLSLKEIQIQRKVEWDGGRLVGHCDLGFGNIDHDYMPEASSALVFYLTALNKSWQLPVGYCLIDNASPVLRANLVIQYLIRCTALGARVIALVADGSVHSYKMFNALGVSLDDVDGDTVSSFVHPVAKHERVKCFVDVNDVILTLSQYIKEKGALVTADGTLVDWSLISKMHKFRDSDLMETEAYRRITDSAKHELYTIYLKMRKERQHPIGRNTTAALAYFKNTGLPDFSDALETCLFLENVFQFESLFETFLLMGKDEPAKRFVEGMAVFCNNVRLLITYFGSLKDLKEGLVFNTKKKLPIILILLNLMSLKSITKIATARRMHFTLYTSKFTLKNLKEFLSEIQSRVGILPSALEFKKAYQDLVENPASRKRPARESLNNDQDLDVGFTSGRAAYEYAPIVTECENVERFLAEKVIRKWAVADAECPECVDILMGSPVRGYLTEPVEGVVARREEITRLVVCVLKITEKRVKISEMPTASTLNRWLDRVTCETLEEIVTTRDWFQNFEHLFECEEFGRTVHYVTMLKGLIRVFLRIRLEFLRQEEAIKIRFPANFLKTTNR